MAPRPPTMGVPVSENEASSSSSPFVHAVDSLPHVAHDLLKRAVATSTASNSSASSTSTSTSTRTATSTVSVNPNFVPGSGTKSANSFDNRAFLALFALLGAAMVVAALWFFFWAKNGGFVFQEGDWDDYKSTVLRRKGPDGRTLTNATRSTKLGGSTIAGTQRYPEWAKRAARSVVSYDEKGRKGLLGKRGWGKTHSYTYRDDFTDYGYDDSKTSAYSEDMREAKRGGARASSPPPMQQRPAGYRDRDVQEYKKEKPARVGGLNRVQDGSSHLGSSHVGGLTNTDLSTSDMYSDSERPILSRKERRGRQEEDEREREKERAERRARTEAAKMERRWKKEAEEAAAALARENHQQQPPPPPTHSHVRNQSRSRNPRSVSQQPKKTTGAYSSVPTSSPGATPTKPSAARARSASRSASPRKQREFSYQSGPESEVLSTAYTGNTKRTSSSYYDAYRPHATGERRQSSPTKKGGRSGGGYRRGAESDLD